MKFDYVLAVSILPLLLQATVVTIEVTVAGFAIALVGGLFLLFLRRSRYKVVAKATNGFVEVIRSTPLLVQVFFLYFVGPQYGIVLTPLQTGIVALGIHYSCYMSEVYRAGLESVPAAQWDAVVALNLPVFTTYARIILPQALPPIIPAAGNFLIYMFKDSPLLFAIGVAELMHVSAKIGSENFQYLEPVTLCGLIFLALSLLCAAILRLVERFLGRRWQFR
jgi:polar amino acid transport system permease protein